MLPAAILKCIVMNKIPMKLEKSYNQTYKMDHTIALEFMITVAPTFALVLEVCRTKNVQVLRASCLTLEINEFRCYEAKIEESEKAGSCRESNPGHLA